MFPLAYVLNHPVKCQREEHFSRSTAPTHFVPLWNGLTGGNIALVGKTSSPLCAGGLAAITNRDMQISFGIARRQIADRPEDSPLFPSIPPAVGVIIETGLGDGLCKAGEGGATDC